MGRLYPAPDRFIHVTERPTCAFGFRTRTREPLIEFSRRPHDASAGLPATRLRPSTAAHPRLCGNGRSVYCAVQAGNGITTSENQTTPKTRTSSPATTPTAIRNARLA